MVWARERRQSSKDGVHSDSVAVTDKPGQCQWRHDHCDVDAAMRDYVGKKLHQAESTQAQ
jgi:hypothetical protein